MQPGPGEAGPAGAQGNGRTFVLGGTDGSLQNVLRPIGADGGWVLSSCTTQTDAPGSRLAASLSGRGFPAPSPTRTIPLAPSSRVTSPTVPGDGTADRVHFIVEGHLLLSFTGIKNRVPTFSTRKESAVEKSFEERVAEARAEVPAVSPQAAKERKDEDPTTLFVDPRNEADIRSSTGIIPGALNIPLSELTEKADADLPQELQSRTRPIITACKGGPMGALAAHALKKRGFSNVAFIEGGTQGWLDAGFSTDK